MKVLATGILCFLSSIAIAQFAIIQDKDGFSKIRSSAAIGNNIITQLKNGSIVHFFEKDGNWINIDFTHNGKEHNGYVYHDRLIPVSEFREVPFFDKTDSSISFKKDLLKIVITNKKVDRSQYTFSYYGNSKAFIQFVNGKRYWGTDGELPILEYRSIIVTIENKELKLPAAAIENLFDPNLNNTKVNFDVNHDTVYIHSLNSDGAGGYEVIWKVERGIYIERHIFYGF